MPMKSMGAIAGRDQQHRAHEARLQDMKRSYAPKEVPLGDKNRQPFFAVRAGLAASASFFGAGDTSA